MKTNTKPFLESVKIWGKYGEFTVAPSLPSAVALKVDNLRLFVNYYEATNQMNQIMNHIRLKNSWPSIQFLLWYENLRRHIVILPSLNVTNDPDQLVQGRIVNKEPARLAKGRWEMLIP